MLKKFLRMIGGDPVKRSIEEYSGLVDQVNELEPRFEQLSDEELRQKTADFRRQLASLLGDVTSEDERFKIEQDFLDEIMPEAFAMVREASKRTIGLRHYDVQLIGGAALHQGKIAEMRTGEGKTLVATLPVYLNAITGNGVHLITVNDYLARRDARWMAPIYHLLGLSVGVLQMAARTENGRKAFVVDLERESSQEDQHQLRMVPRGEAYACDITYGTNSEFGFDYLRDNMTMRLEDRVQRGHYYAIIDEVDNVLIDEARTPLIISGPAQDEAENYIRMAQVVKQLKPEDYEIDEKDRTVTLTELGETHVEEILGIPLRDPDRPEDLTPEQARLLGYLEQALRAQFLYRKNKDYLVQGGKVVIVDEFTGRLMPGRRWSDGLHQAVEAKEGVKVESESVTYATITIQNYFRMYKKLAGMTGTALTEAEEFDKIYKLSVLAIPTNLEYQAAREEFNLTELEARDEEGYKYKYYARKDDPEQKPVFWRRKDYPDVVYRTEEAKLRAIAREILRFNTLGRPILVGTTSVELSERVSSRLGAEAIRRLAQVILIRDLWMNQHGLDEDGRQVPELQYLNEPIEKLDIASMRKMARELGMALNPDEETNRKQLLRLLALDPEDEELNERLSANLQGGIKHEVLNARKHTEESQIIAGAGAFGAVTIATNMAGRGVDIKLGGELPEDTLSTINRLLSRKVENPFELTMEQRRQAILEMDPDEYGIYEAEVQEFLQYLKNMDRVHQLGGLHVIGSERHEARRIDNQLRGRAARQGDPGSSRFYLSMEDDLMRLFGGQQADALMQRMKIDDALPLEVGLVGRLVEQSQTRVEGANFDVRKHLLEYDDVLNTQRSKIYAQRNRIFTKEDLTDDVTEMLRTEVTRRVPQALEDEGGPWKLLAWLDQIQPPVILPNRVFPSYTLRLLTDHILDGRQSLDPKTAVAALQDVARSSLQAEQEHLMSTIDVIIDQTAEKLDSQLAERMELVDTYLEGLAVEDETETQARRPTDIVQAMSNELRIPLKLSPEQQRQLRHDPEAVSDAIREQVETVLVSQSVARLIGSVERRLDDRLDLIPSQLEMDDWNRLGDQILGAVERVYDRRRERFLGENGQITRELETAIARMSGPVGQAEITRLLHNMPLGSVTTFDKRTHRRVLQRTVRLSYTYYAAQFIQGREPEEIAADVLDHLEQAQDALQEAWGMADFSRIAGMSPAELGEAHQKALVSALGEERYAEVENLPLQQLSSGERELVIEELGRLVLTNTYRQLMLRVVSELWVDYLTQMEGLRVSIGLEAYGQRDPLVQYKSRAFELFQNLLSDMRLGVITRMFTYRPGDLSPIQTVQAGSAPAAIPAQADGGAPAEAGDGETPSPAGEKEKEAVVEAAAQQPEPRNARPLDRGQGKDKGEKISTSKKRRRSRR